MTVKLHSLTTGTTHWSQGDHPQYHSHRLVAHTTHCSQRDQPQHHSPMLTAQATHCSKETSLSITVTDIPHAPQFTARYSLPWHDTLQNLHLQGPAPAHQAVGAGPPCASEALIDIVAQLRQGPDQAASHDDVLEPAHQDAPVVCPSCLCIKLRGARHQMPGYQLRCPSA